MMMHMFFGERPGCVLIGACALIRMNTVFLFYEIYPFIAILMNAMFIIVPVLAAATTGDKSNRYH